MISHFSVARLLYSGSAILRGLPAWALFFEAGRGDALCPRGIWVGSRTLPAAVIKSLHPSICIALHCQHFLAFPSALVS